MPPERGIRIARAGGIRGYTGGIRDYTRGIRASPAYSPDPGDTPGHGFPAVIVFFSALLCREDRGPADTVARPPRVQATLYALTSPTRRSVCARTFAVLAEIDMLACLGRCHTKMGTDGWARIKMHSCVLKVYNPSWVPTRSIRKNMPKQFVVIKTTHSESPTSTSKPILRMFKIKVQTMWPITTVPCVIKLAL